MKLFSHLVLVFGLLLGFSSFALAEPHFSAASGQDCFLCHSNPTGNWMRSLYGSQFFAPQYLTHKPVDQKWLDKLHPDLSESVTIGADLRTIFLAENTTHDTSRAGLSAPWSTNTGNISQMEGYLYLSFQPSDKITIDYSQGVASAAGRFEAFGTAYVLPLHGYLKAGQFQENYGWNFADHTSFVRTGLFQGYDGSPTASGTAGSIPNPPPYGVGGEVGIRPWKFDITASYTGSQSTIPTTRDSQKRWFARAMIMQGWTKYHLNFSLGGSWFDAPQKSADPELTYLPSASRYSGWGGFGSIGWSGLKHTLGCNTEWGFLTSTLLFEYDRKAWTPATDAVTSAYSTTQLSIQVQPGLWLQGSYDWLDLSSTVTGDQANRTTLGIQCFPLPWVEISPRYRLYTAPSSVAAQYPRHQKQAELQIHFFF